MRKLFLLSIIMASSVLTWAGDVIVSSPNGGLKVTISDAGGRLYYAATLDGQEVLQPSALGLKTSLGDLTRNLSIKDTKTGVIDETYQMRGTKASSASYKANTLTLNILSDNTKKDYDSISEVLYSFYNERNNKQRLNQKGIDLKHLVS